MIDDPYRLRPSAAGRWMNCPGSVAREHDTGDEDETGPAASEGQAAHAVAARALLTGQPVDAQEGRQQYDDAREQLWPVNADMVDDLRGYCSAVREAAAQPGASLWIEERLDYPAHLQGWTIDNATGEVVRSPKTLGGTSDAIVWDPAERHLQIFDLKYGRNVIVESHNNPQLWIYALLAMHALHLPPLHITAHIIQPRAFHEDGPHRSQAIDLGDLLAFDLDLFTAVDRAGAPDATLHAAPDGRGWCRFCSAREDCPERLAQAVVAARELSQTVESIEPMWPSPVPPEQLDSATLARVLPWLDIIDRWGKDARAVALQRSEAEDIPGYKRVAGRSTRVWKPGTDAAVLDEALAHDMTLGDISLTKPAELLSPAQVEKQMGKRKFRELLGDGVERKPGNPRLIRDDEQGRELGRSAENEFDSE